ncbi:Trichothecene biosynthesis transcription regulator TRI10 [Psilocybe cubensis]|uniref:Trichothecene biosynthesis transcription regulator TRI10 n=1 Tax=Psilocybe cubensis TaxID=181762 RepID=A0ACB8H0U6_PSICU|nr:Trichothecene biosynthesis transcription regulator TRI10 [Psilocybe cubensis]KAH9481307.1 Trichothecene biosynthesis transcription regulator TRI10 [Psilocybe cubensis]
MAYQSHTPSPAGTPSPSSSTSVSPYINPSPLDMVANDDHDSSYSAQGTPNHSTTNLPRTLNAGKGGCWTCRVRRKKCDEQREGDSCRTCKRLTIKCLGWGAKRPDWMRDKKNVDAYKASIKAQLSRAGLIRGQPRHNPMQVPSHRAVQQQQRQQVRQTTVNSHTGSVNVTRTNFESFHHPLDTSFNAQHGPHLMSGMTGAPSSFDDHISRQFDTYDPTFFQQTALFNPSLGGENTDFGLLSTQTANDVLFQDPTTMPAYNSPANQTAVQEELVMHYFSNVQKAQPFFAGEALTDITYSAILEEPRGAVTFAICALAELHLKQMRVSQGLEPINAAAETSTNYLRNEAVLQLDNNKNTHGCWSEKDAIAALHLVSLSQLSGGASDWESPFTILCQWLHQTNLHLAENPWLTFLSLTASVQHLVKATLWLDVFSSMSTLRPPKFLPLWQKLLGEKNFYDLDLPRSMHMEALTGCPDEALLAIAEISALAHWKTSQIRNGCLSYPDLIRRGTVIEQQLRRQTEQSVATDGVQTGLGSANATHPSVEERSLIANIFREAADLYLHSVLSNSTPGVPEIGSCVTTIVRLFTQLPASEVDRTLVFPICLAGCMTNDSTVRDFFKGRLRLLNESYGNLLQTRRLMEAVWQKRDIGGKEVDFRETIREQGLKLLLI